MKFFKNIIGKLFGFDKEIIELRYALEKSDRKFSILRYNIMDCDIIDRKIDAENKIMEADVQIRKQQQRLELLEKGYDIESGFVKYVSKLKT